MSRSCYSDDYGDDFPGQMELYRANVERSLRGYFGQQRLKELRDALLALPVKELHEDTFAAGSNEAPRVCALGAWALAKCGDVEKARELIGLAEDDEDTADVLKSHGWPRLVVMDAIYMNDDYRPVHEYFEGPSQSPYAYYGGYRGVLYTRQETPAERYERVLAWVERQIAPPRATRDAPQ
jgi:hypothetical protein